MDQFLACSLGNGQASSNVGFLGYREKHELTPWLWHSKCWEQAGGAAFQGCGDGFAWLPFSAGLS